MFNFNIKTLQYLGRN